MRNLRGEPGQHHVTATGPVAVPLDGMPSPRRHEHRRLLSRVMPIPPSRLSSPRFSASSVMGQSPYAASVASWIGSRIEMVRKCTDGRWSMASAPRRSPVDTRSLEVPLLSRIAPRVGLVTLRQNLFVAAEIAHVLHSSRGAPLCRAECDRRNWLLGGNARVRWAHRR
jgi:hypothetical protein